MPRNSVMAGYFKTLLSRHLPAREAHAPVICYAVARKVDFLDMIEEAIVDGMRLKQYRSPINGGMLFVVYQKDAIDVFGAPIGTESYQIGFGLLKNTVKYRHLCKGEAHTTQEYVFLGHYEYSLIECPPESLSYRPPTFFHVRKAINEAVTYIIEHMKNSRLVPATGEYIEGRRVVE
jgi:hypothetical protein